ncbi:MFS transporter [Rhodococcus sp. AD45-ID]|nr:enterobactin exporter EntS [Rhodococcus sp. AD45]PSR42887.1 MFS transporter [Rhodococcus sp. AD45-ID]
MLQTFRSLSIPNYRRYAAGAVVSNVGTWMQRIGQDWLVLQLTDNSGTAVGITTSLQFLPVLLISPLAGLLADRYPKRRLMQVTQVMMAFPALILGILAVTGAAQPWHVYAIAFVFGIGAALDAPARQSFVPELVGPEDLTNAVGLNSVSFNTARVVGPAFAGVLIAAFGSGSEAAGWVILLNALSYIAVIYALQSIDPDLLSSPKPQERRKGMLLEAVRYLRGRPDLLFVFVIVFFVGAFGINFQLTTALMSTQEFGKSAGEFGLLTSAMAVGSFVGALAAARRSTISGRLVMFAALAFGGALAVGGLMPTYLTFAIWTPLIGLSAMTMITAAQANIQLKVHPEFRGRVTALYVMVSMGGAPIGAPIIGWIGETFGPRWTLFVGAAVALSSVVGAVAAFGWPTRAESSDAGASYPSQPVR